MYEINLVPEVKRDMIKALRVRNIILFVCIAVSAVMVTIVLVMLGIKGGQDLVMNQQKTDIDNMSGKLHELDNLNEFIAIQDQLGKLSNISNNKQAASRLFGILTAIQPTTDTVAYSELKLDLAENTLTVSGQADAGPNTDGIDYRALESYRKGIDLTRYDYGDYVDQKGATIPFYCVEDADENGNPLKENDQYYGNWYINRTDCNPSKQEVPDTSEAYSIKIWRTPQFQEWYKTKKMTDSGEISDVEHFQSQCIKYKTSDGGKKWETENNCKLAEESFKVTESSNGLDESDNLVLRFSGTLKLNQEVLRLANRHMRFINPSGQNVTDSYNQVKNMFTKRAKDCDKNDATCQNTQNATGGNNGQ